MNEHKDIRTSIAADPELDRLHTHVAGVMDDDPGHDITHVLRVAHWTVQIGSDADVDTREAIAAALLHDIVNVPKNSPDRKRASALCADAATELLPGFGFDPVATARIADAILTHSFSRGEVPRSPLGEALQDADRLEAVGVIGVFRTISTGTLMGAKYFDSSDPWAAKRPLDDYAFSIDHFFTKLLTLHETMRTAAGRAEAKRRTQFLEVTLDQLAIELGAPRTR
ncbi:MAG: hypothetical protein ACI9MR_004977 [Myxococcota bacterium]|jgi:uncharacterized protein